MRQSVVPSIDLNGWDDDATVVQGLLAPCKVGSVQMRWLEGQGGSRLYSIYGRVDCAPLEDAALSRLETSKYTVVFPHLVHTVRAMHLVYGVVRIFGQFPTSI